MIKITNIFGYFALGMCTVSLLVFGGATVTILIGSIYCLFNDFSFLTILKTLILLLAAGFVGAVTFVLFLATGILYDKFTRSPSDTLLMSLAYIVGFFLFVFPWVIFVCWSLFSSSALDGVPTYTKYVVSIEFVIYVIAVIAMINNGDFGGNSGSTGSYTSSTYDDQGRELKRVTLNHYGERTIASMELNPGGHLRLDPGALGSIKGVCRNADGKITDVRITNIFNKG